MIFNKKKKLIGVSVVAGLLLTIGAIGVTFALLQTSTQAVQNSFAGAAVNVGVVENGAEGVLENTSNTVEYPHISEVGVTKEVRIQNITSTEFPTTDTYVRVRLVPVFRDTVGATVPIAAGDLQNNVVYTFAEDSKWLVKEIAGEDYYYYSESLAPGALSEALITAVAYTGEVPSDAEFELQVLVEGIAAHQPNALEAWGLEGGFADSTLQSVQ